MPKKSSKKGGNRLLPEDANKTVFYPNLLLNPNISTQPNLDTSYKEIGIIYKSTSVAKNIIMEYKYHPTFKHLAYFVIIYMFLRHQK